MNKPSVLLETPRLASWCDWTGIDPLPLGAGDRSSIVWLRSGTGEASLANCRLPISEGTCLFVPPCAEVTLRPSPDIPLRAVVFYLSCLHVQGFAKGYLSNAELPFNFPAESHRSRIYPLLEDILHECLSPKLGSHELISSLLHTLIIHLLRAMDAAAEVTSAENNDVLSQEDDSVPHTEAGLSVAYTVRGYIEQHFNEDLSLSDLAQKVFVSPYHLAHVFKEEIGMSPIQYLIKCRIDAAKRLLVETELSVREIALNVGYPNANYFNLLFSKLSGHSPGKFRKRN